MVVSQAYYVKIYAVCFHNASYLRELAGSLPEGKYWNNKKVQGSGSG